MSGIRTLRRAVLCMVLAVPAAFAGNTDGSVVGHTQANAVVTGTSPATDLTRTVIADDKGNYRFPFLPIDFQTPRYAQLSRSADS
jgi:hypothetical protein